MLKSQWYLVLTMCLWSCLPTPAHAASAKEKSLKVALHAAAREVVQHPPSEATRAQLIAESVALMLREPSQHRVAQESQALLESLARQRIQDALTQEFQQVYRSFQSRELSMTEADYLKDVQQAYAPAITERLAAFLRAHGTQIFSDARQQAVNQQLGALTLSAYPTQAEVDAVDRAHWQAAAVENLRRAMSAAMQRQNQKTVKVLFEENESEVSQAAAAILDRIRAQVRQQAEALNAPVAEALLTQEQIAADRQQQVTRVIDDMRRQAGKGEMIYAPVPSVNEAITASAKRLERERFLKAASRFPYPVSSDRLRALIAENPAQHRRQADSLKIVMARLLPEFSGAFLTSYTEPVKTQPECAAFRERLRQAAANDAETQQALTAILQQAITTPLQETRAALAAAQFRTSFGPVASGAWTPSEDLLKQIDLHDDRIRTVDEALRLPGIAENTPQNSSTRLEETEALLLAALEVLIGEGERAWDGQLDLVRRQERELRATILNDRREKSEAEWAADYTGRIAGTWDDIRKQTVWQGARTPPSEKYRALFRYTQAEVEKLVHTAFETAQKARQERETHAAERLVQERLVQERRAAQRRVDVQPNGYSPGGNTVSSNPGSSAAAPEQGGRVVKKERPVVHYGLWGKFNSVFANMLDGVAEMPWWLWMLLFMLVAILCLGAVVILLLRETQTLPRQLGLMAASIRVSDQETVITTRDLDEAVKKFARGLGVQPTTQSAHEAVFTIRFKTG